MTPYDKFGKVLYALRRKYHVTRRELCGALEIDEEYLTLLESGAEKPTEELVELMISHFALDDSLAENLWRLAGYPVEKLEDNTTQTVYMPMQELKVQYTDMVHVSVNNYGVVLNFLQNSGPNNQPVVVSRLGMSKEHAESVVDVISRTLKRAQDQKNAPSHKTLPTGEKPLDKPEQ